MGKFSDKPVVRSPTAGRRHRTPSKGWRQTVLSVKVSVQDAIRNMYDRGVHQHLRWCKDKLALVFKMATSPVREFARLQQQIRTLTKRIEELEASYQGLHRAECAQRHAIKELAEAHSMYDAIIAAGRTELEQISQRMDSLATGGTRRPPRPFSAACGASKSPTSRLRMAAAAMKGDVRPSDESSSAAVEGLPQSPRRQLGIRKARRYDLSRAASAGAGSGTGSGTGSGVDDGETGCEPCNAIGAGAGNGAGTLVLAPEAPARDVKFVKYHKMLSVGIPSGAVLQKVRLEGLSTPTFRQEAGLSPSSSDPKTSKPATITAGALRTIKLRPTRNLATPTPATLAIDTGAKNSTIGTALARTRSFGAVTLSQLQSVKLRPTHAQAALKSAEGGSSTGAQKENSSIGGLPGKIAAPKIASAGLDLSQILSVRLRTAPGPRSPGGTPCRPSHQSKGRNAGRSHMDFLQNALVTRFAAANRPSPEPSPSQEAECL